MGNPEIVVVGAGVNGLAAAHSLAAGGRATLVLEQFEVGNHRASSHGASRIFRLSHERVHEVAEARRALALWRRLEQESGTQLLELHGSLDIGRDLGAHVEALRSAGVPFEVAGADEVRHRFGVAIAEESQALVQLDGGIVRADRALGALRRSAEACGVVLREGERAVRLLADPGGVTIETDERRIEAEAVVVAAGPWAAGLLDDAGVELDATPTRETVVYFELEGPPVPSLIDWLVPEGYSFAREPLALYALHAPHEGLKVGVHHAGPVTDPDAEGEVDREAVRLASDWVGERFLNANPHAVAAETCLYTSNPGLEPVLEAHGRIIVASSCNGHGFKFAPAVGETIAGLVAAAVQAPSDPEHHASA